jgi:hypothetical protein
LSQAIPERRAGQAGQVNDRFHRYLLPMQKT